MTTPGTAAGKRTPVSSAMMPRLIPWIALACAARAAAAPPTDNPTPPVRGNARVAFTEDWSTGRIDSAKWYLLRKKWGEGHNGVVPENVRVERDVVAGAEQNVLVCVAHGDQYDGPVTGERGNKPRVGGVIVSKPFFASGRFEVVMKIGSTDRHDGGPENPTRPAGAVPAVWTYAYRFARAPRDRAGGFSPDQPLYNPHLCNGRPVTMYWSELDFPEYGKAGEFAKAMYNTFCQDRHHPETFDVRGAADGRYHTYTTEWRTKLEPLPGVADAQVIEHDGYWWVQDKSVPIDRYLGNPLKRLGKDQYAVYAGAEARHWIDGHFVARNTQYVPAMAAQLNLGVWLPDWAGPAPWKTAHIRYASVKVWQYDDPGDVRGVLTADIGDSFAPDGRPLR
jgi:hypothetical protein